MAAGRFFAVRCRFALFTALLYFIADVPRSCCGSEKQKHRMTNGRFSPAHTTLAVTRCMFQRECARATQRAFSPWQVRASSLAVTPFGAALTRSNPVHGAVRSLKLLFFPSASVK